ncbi:tyrosine-type recombinase/integrase [Sphingomonas sp. Leaf339]|uniref:tyrosine-type recombinase/integrase n=1 Tax=Sphingomonas sp. Leaf339 TaxID=1736343 RepID=UPI0009EB5C33|nr:site-specific integrase [Sphingomonas sp. Leaf339]
MPNGKITKRSVDALQPKDRDEFMWDTDLRGFGVKITPKGTKTYIVQYRMGGRSTGTSRWTIGQHGAWSPNSAREEAERILRKVGSGTDPRIEANDKAAADQARKLDNIRFDFATYGERFLAEYGKQKWRPRTYASAESNMRRWVFPTLAGKSLLTIERRDVVSIFDRLPSSSPALPRSIFALVRKLFTWAVERGDLERSPIEGMGSPAAVASRDRVLSDHELSLIAVFADDLGAPFAAFFRLLIVTGQRRDEVAGMSWSEVDRDSLEWVIPARRSKNAKEHTVPLNDLALIELDGLAGGNSWPHAGFVFTTTGKTPISGYSKAKMRLDGIVQRHSIRPISAWRIHDLRRTFATAMQRLNVRFEVTEALLNHVSGSKSGTAGVYQRHDWKPEKRVAMDAWAVHLQKLIAKLADSS